MRALDYNKFYTLFPRLEELELFRWEDKEKMWLPELWWFGSTLRSVKLLVSFYLGSSAGSIFTTTMSALVDWLKALPPSVEKLEIVNVHARPCPLVTQAPSVLSWLK